MTHAPSASPRPSRRLRFGAYDCAAFLTFFTYASGSVVVPVALVQLSQDLGFDLGAGGMAAGGALPLGRTTMMVVSLLLCGFVAGRFGKLRAFGSSVVLMGAGLGICAMAPSYGLLFLALALTGTGEGVIEGLATPFVQDLHPAEPGRYTNFAHAFWPIGVLTTVLVSGALLAAGVSWRLLLGGIAALSVVPAVLLLLPPRGGQRYPDHPARVPWRHVRDQALAVVLRRRFWLFFAAMFVAGGGESCLTFWSASYIQLNLAGSAWAGGVGTACFAAGMMLGRTGWGYLLHQTHLRPLVLWSAVAGALVTLALPLLGRLEFFFAALFISGVCTAPFWPSVQSYATDRLQGVDTTMVLVLLSSAGVPGCGFFTWLMGLVANRAGLGNAFYLVPACYVVLAGLMLLDGVAVRAEGRARAR